MFGGLWTSLALVGAAIAAVFGYGVLMRKSGADANEAEHDKATVEAATTRAATQDEVARTAPATRREELKRWARK